ncbi:hypothetical protein BDV38DRAFT_281159 [Aspergillus pseudotamarii]|uniref:F-box domain-containing protein n=1 Tax=Aspergillus pseudotamarii TaxID=132259 RepID=A0A5N6T026_ASPPS|nr:uncharacterized protein BDV38DRAFT_281159 [Aspergillus pseudotamarii]KAE8139391.1 hypothetical protein BDV38DRAFT_281159 [Aspergillus pseudotamarii]
MNVPDPDKVIAVFRIPECAKSIFKHLTRYSLKCLRLTCKDFDDLVVSPLSHLFSRVYISFNRMDLWVLGWMSQHPRIAPCVEELVWDVSMEIKRRAAIGARHSKNPYDIGRIIRDYNIGWEEGMDLGGLYQTLPLFPRLKHITITELMSRWMTIPHRCQSATRQLPPTRPHGPCFESPAMRQWRMLQMGPVEENVYNYLDCCSRSCIQDPDAEAKLVAFLQAIRHDSDRAHLIFLKYGCRWDIQLQSYCIDAPPPPTSSRRPFNGMDLRAYLDSDEQKEMFLPHLRFLRKLSLSFDNTNDSSQLHDWHEGFYTGRLETLQLRVYKQEHFLSSMLGASFPCLRKLALSNFALEDCHLEDKLLPWCFETKLHTLDLDVMFVTTRRLTGRDVMNWLISKDVDRCKYPPSDSNSVNSSSRDSIQGGVVPDNHSGNDETRASGEMDNTEPTISSTELEGESFNLRLSGATWGWGSELLHVNIHLFRWAEAE